MNGNSPRKPMGKAARVLISLAVTLVFGLVYFYLSLPALNLQDGNFYTFVFVLCIVFVVASLFTSGFRMAPGSGVKEYFRFVKTQCLPVGVLMVLLIAVGIIGLHAHLPGLRLPGPAHCGGWQLQPGYRPDLLRQDPHPGPVLR